MDLRDTLESTYAGLERDHLEVKRHYQDLQEYLTPRRGRWLMTDRNKVPQYTKIINNAGTRASRTLASGMMAGITSPARPWFRLRTGDRDLDEYPAVKGWLDQVRTLMMEIFSGSNVYNALHTLYGEQGVFGTGGQLLLQDFQDVIRAYPTTVGSYMLGVNNRMVADIVGREVPMTVRQVVAEFGLDNVSTAVRQLYDKSAYNETVPVRHVVLPNAETHGGLPDRGMAYQSVYWEKGSDKEEYLRQTGFREFPGQYPRWDVVGVEPYGFGPGTIALGDVRQLQEQEKQKGKGLHKMVNPPLQAPSTMQEAGPINSMPGGVSWYDATTGGKGASPLYQVNLDINSLRGDMQEVEIRISEAFYEPLFLMLAQSDRRQITAREIEERHEEKLLMLGPVLERLHNELLDPLIDRTYAIAQRAGILPPIPPELEAEGVTDLGVEYISMMAQAQKAVGAASIERTFGFAGNLVAIFPEARHKLDALEAIEAYAEMNGAPAGVVRSKEEAEALMAQEAQAAQAAMQQQQMATEAANAKVLADTKVGDANALERVLGVG